MGRASFLFKLKDDKIEAYKNIHKNVWVELQDTLRKAGRRNYSIWYAGGFIFGYYEADDIEKTGRILKDSEIVKRWNEYMESFDLVDKDFLPSIGKSGFYDMEMVFCME